MELLNLTTERVDDIPVLTGQIERMEVAEALNAAFPAHGNWEGLSLGQVAGVWLIHLLSEADHCLDHVRPWVETRLETLRALVDPDLKALDFTDDRLAAILRRLSRDDDWAKFEASLNRRLVRVYALDEDGKPSAVRLDATTASSYAPVTESGLLQYGFSKDHRPDLGQLKIMMAALDPWGVPLVALVASGERADDPLYLPVIERARESLSGSGRLYVGDCKLASMATRAYLASNEEFYLAPLSETAWIERDDDLAKVRSGALSMAPIERDGEKIAEGGEFVAERRAEVEGKEIAWTERRLIVRSVAFAESQEKALTERMRKAVAATASLNERKKGKRRPETRDDWEEATRSIIRRCQVEGLIAIEIVEETIEREVRPYRDRPARTEIEREFRATATIDEKALEERKATLGVRAYVTNASAERLPLAEAIEAYRNEYRIERGFERLKGKPLSLTPFYLQRDDHLKGLARFLTIALRVPTLLEGVVRRGLRKEGAVLTGLYGGQPTRKTERPTAEMMLKAFKGITLTLLHLPEGIRLHFTPLTPLQQRILRFLDLPASLFSFSLSRPKMGEP